MDLNEGQSASDMLNVSESPINGYFQGYEDETAKESGHMGSNTVLNTDSGTILVAGQASDLTDATFCYMSRVHLNQAESSVVQDTKLNENTEFNENRKKGGWPKGKKRKKTARDTNAPKQSLTGYVRFLNDRRDRVRADHPSMPFSEITKLLGAEWSRLVQLDKQTYLDDAEKDKERYLKELDAYHQTEAYKLFLSKQQERKRKELLEEAEAAEPVTASNSGLEMIGDVTKMEEDENAAAFDIPIFTEEFLDHNKLRETELRQLRRRNTEYEEQNAILGKHIANMKAAICKLEVAGVQQRTSNVSLQQHLHGLRTTLAANFGSTPLPDSLEVPSMDTIDSYMAKLHMLILDSPQENEDLIANVREIIGRLNFEG